jgi:predicted RNA-binding protein with RPS1 domain
MNKNNHVTEEVMFALVPSFVQVEFMEESLIHISMVLQEICKEIHG